MADYSSMKVPELKKLLQEKSLPVTGNKADLIARLQEHDKKTAPAPAAEDEIDYSDDEPAPAVAEKPAEPAKTTEPAPVPAAAAPVTEPVVAAEETATAEAPVAASEDKAEEAPKEDFALHLSATDASEEARKRAERAKRFGLVEDDETKKKADRAKRFGIDDKELGGLDSALPERPLKRGRGGVDEEPSAKRQSMERQTGRHGGKGRGRGRRGDGAGGRDPKDGNSGAAKKGGAPIDPTEKAKMEARAKRFAS